MSVGLRGDNLIFLISQPRAGSTLFQRILGSHPDIYTTAEPWIMLHPLYALRENGYLAEYGADLARETTLDFLHSLPGGDEAYLDGTRHMYAHLYTLALEQSGKRYFLDKTPPYYYIIPDLARVFPDARYIILLRNPLAVLGSILAKWLDGNWLDLWQYGDALVRAPRLLLEGINYLGPRALVVRFENLVADPDREIPRICDWLNVEFRPEMVNYGQADLPRWTNIGDEKEVYEHQRPVSQNATKWVQSLANPQVWRFTNDYLNALGRTTIEEMGYSFDELQDVLEQRRPGKFQEWRAMPLSLALKTNPGLKSSAKGLLISGARRLAFAASGLGSR